MKSDTEIVQEMDRVYPLFWHRWCEAKMCCCLGCVNTSSALTKEEWLRWCELYPDDLLISEKWDTEI